MEVYDELEKALKELEKKDKVINDLLKRISDLEFEVERLEKRVEQEKRIVDIKDKDIVRLYERIDKAIEYIMTELITEWDIKNDGYVSGSDLPVDAITPILDILKGVDEE